LFKRIFLSSGLYSIPALAQQVISTLMLPVVTASLSREDYAVLGTLEQVGILLALLLGGCFGCSIGYFYYERDTAEERRPVIGTSILGAVFAGLLTAVVCWVLAVPLTRLVFHHDGYAFYLRFMILGAAPSFALEALLGWARVANRPRTYVIGALARGLVGAAAALILAVFFRLTILGMLAAGIASVTVPFLMLGPACWRATRPTFDSPLFVRMVKFYFFVGLGGLAMFCINFGDRLLLWRHASGPEIGDYVLAYKIGMLSILAYNSFYSYWGSNMFDLMKRDDADALFARLLTYAAGAIVVPCLGLTIFARPAIRMLAHHNYSGAAVFVPAIAFAYGIRCLGDFFRSRFYVAGRPGYDALCNWAGAALCLGGYLYWIPRLGVWGAVLATAVAFAALLGIGLIWTYRIRPYRVEGGRLVKMAIAMAAVLAAFAALPMASLGGQIAFGALLMAAFPGLLWILGFPTPAERELLRAAIQRVRAGVPPAR
jgi:O-antigen/teichoic acid export membrane protein